MKTQPTYFAALLSNIATFIPSLVRRSGAIAQAFGCAGDVWLY